MAEKKTALSVILGPVSIEESPLLAVLDNLPEHSLLLLADYNNNRDALLAALRRQDEIMRAGVQVHVGVGGIAVASGGGGGDGGGDAGGQGVGTTSADTIALLRHVLREERKVASVALSSMSASHWTLIQQTGRLKLRFLELRLEGNFEDVMAFEWNMELHEDAQSDRYMEHLKTLFGLLHPANNASFLSWVEGGQKEKNFLTQTGLADRLHFERIAGNMDAAIVSRTSLRCDDARQGVYLLFELKKKPERFNVYQARGELLLANLLSPERRPVVILTDLVDDWRLLWLDGRDVCEGVFTHRSTAVYAVNQIIAQAELAAGYETTGAPVLADSVQIYGMPQTYSQRQPAPDLLYMGCPPDRMDTDLAELTSLRGLIPDDELRHALAARFMQQACRLPQFAAPPISRAPSSMYV